MPNPRPQASDYRYFAPTTTRWMDNDVYSYINNVAYCGYFDSVVNHYLIRDGGLDIERSEIIGLVVEPHCNYHAPVTCPQSLRAGLRNDRLGKRSIASAAMWCPSRKLCARRCPKFLYKNERR